jgi:hypothetical protein
VRGEPSGKRWRDACGVATLTGDKGDGGAPTEFIEGEWSLVLEAA